MVSCAIQPEDTLYQAIATPRSNRRSETLDLSGARSNAACEVPMGCNHRQRSRATAARVISRKAANMRRNARKYVGIDASICVSPCDESKGITSNASGRDPRPHANCFTHLGPLQPLLGFLSPTTSGQKRLKLRNVFGHPVADASIAVAKLDGGCSERVTG